MEIEAAEKKRDKKAYRTETTTHTGSEAGHTYTYTTQEKKDTDAKKIFDAAANKYGTNNIGASEIEAIIKELKDSN
jgi:hypothetical protein